MRGVHHAGRTAARVTDTADTVDIVGTVKDTATASRRTRAGRLPAGVLGGTRDRPVPSYA